jgi:hypothetical protein
VSSYDYRDAILKALKDNHEWFGGSLFDAIEPEYKIKREVFDHDLKVLVQQGIVEEMSDEYDRWYRLVPPKPPMRSREVVTAALQQYERSFGFSSEQFTRMWNQGWLQHAIPAFSTWAAAINELAQIEASTKGKP